MICLRTGFHRQTIRPIRKNREVMERKVQPLHLGFRTKVLEDERSKIRNNSRIF